MLLSNQKCCLLLNGVSTIDNPKFAKQLLIYINQNFSWIEHGRRNRGAQGAIILPSEIFLTQYALLSRKLAHKMFIFSKILRLASLANKATSN